jgi:hypothetical protein
MEGETVDLDRWLVAGDHAAADCAGGGSVGQDSSWWDGPGRPRSGFLVRGSGSFRVALHQVGAPLACSIRPWLAGTVAGADETRMRAGEPHSLGHAVEGGARATGERLRQAGRVPG